MFLVLIFCPSSWEEQKKKRLRSLGSLTSLTPENETVLGMQLPTLEDIESGNTAPTHPAAGPHRC
eukprot:8848259-Lingulodinium_polyedra.AAC.1